MMQNIIIELNKMTERFKKRKQLEICIRANVERQLVNIIQIYLNRYSQPVNSIYVIITETSTSQPSKIRQAKQASRGITSMKIIFLPNSINESKIIQGKRADIIYLMYVLSKLQFYSFWQNKNPIQNISAKIIFNYSFLCINPYMLTPTNLSKMK
ncbi:hypothetical protein TTHERM_00845870 (macronuclear) [Tetrahymena thermophila SB210]|uniref:Uncharacterized protein n=1 Tax=Tetrahymena thermophila (strain SB210) TaxID=312017 RepID=Q22UU4_TETTS|nr:hypothetical protein TTHERM_00845870 [Tetrahymena thermophila SB210]EAR89032.2 hypothetical protein TTHERM_00845870 [Tetrahymena thermophila SB210]|eukprot:XP_001009277.2 hypothetical protein TTHERM_00845870 [Tetrahymena thermophila SB210]